MSEKKAGPVIIEESGITPPVWDTENLKNIIVKRPCGCVVTFYRATNYTTMEVIPCPKHSELKNEPGLMDIYEEAVGLKDAFLVKVGYCHTE